MINNFLEIVQESSSLKKVKNSYKNMNNGLFECEYDIS